MNDSEIVSALYHCNGGDCEECKALGKCHADWTFLKEAYRLIKRQQAEIDTMKDTMAKLLNTLERANKYGLGADERIEQLKIELEKAKSEAVREFAESLKRKSELVAPSVWAIPYRAVAVADIDKLMEGMGCNDG